VESSGKGYLTIKSAAEYADVCPRTVRSWLRSGLYHIRPNRKLVLIKVSELDKFLARFGTTEKESEQIVRELEGELTS
jgi:excisionase family DNA binding protein